MPEPSLVDQLLENPLLPAGGVAVLGLLGLLAWRKRKQQAAAASAFNDSSLEVAPAPDSLFDSSGGQQIDTNSDTPGQHHGVLAKPVGCQWRCDPIAKADVYLAYGKEDEAIKNFGRSPAQRPDRLNIHIKLAEIYAKQQDLTQLGSDGARRQGLTRRPGERLGAACRTLGFNMDPYNALYAEGTTTGAAAAGVLRRPPPGFAQALAQSTETAAPTPSLESELLIPPSIQDDDSTDQFIASIDSSLDIQAPPSQPSCPPKFKTPNSWRARSAHKRPCPVLTSAASILTCLPEPKAPPLRRPRPTLRQHLRPPRRWTFPGQQLRLPDPQPPLLKHRPRKTILA